MEETDVIGVPLRLKTIEFYKSVQEKLTDEGLVVFNLNGHAKLKDDIETIRRAFPQVYVFRLANVSYVAVASMSEDRKNARNIRATARVVDQRLRANFSFQRMLGNLQQE